MELKTIELVYHHPLKDNLYTSVKLYKKDDDVWAEVYKRYYEEEVVNTERTILRKKKAHFKLNLSKSKSYSFTIWELYENLAEEILKEPSSLFVDTYKAFEGSYPRFFNKIIINDVEYNIYSRNPIETEPNHLLNKLGYTYYSLGQLFYFMNMSFYELSAVMSMEDCEIIFPVAFDEDEPNKYN